MKIFLFHICAMRAVQPVQAPSFSSPNFQFAVATSPQIEGSQSISAIQSATDYQDDLINENIGNSNNVGDAGRSELILVNAAELHSLINRSPRSNTTNVSWKY